VLLNQSEEIMDRIYSPHHSNVPIHSGVTSNAAELVKALAGKSGHQAPRTTAVNQGAQARYQLPDDPLAELMGESDPFAGQELLKREPQLSRHFDPVIKMVAELRNHPAIKKYKDLGTTGSWSMIFPARQVLSDLAPFSAPNLLLWRLGGKNKGKQDVASRKSGDSCRPWMVASVSAPYAGIRAGRRSPPPP
jgi:hypothetical protein